MCHVPGKGVNSPAISNSSATHGFSDAGGLGEFHVRSRNAAVAGDFPRPEYQGSYGSIVPMWLVATDTLLRFGSRWLWFRCNCHPLGSVVQWIGYATKTCCYHFLQTVQVTVRTVPLSIRGCAFNSSGGHILARLPVQGSPDRVTGRDEP